MPAQLSLFPDGHELREQALAALRTLDLPRAMRFVDRAHAVEPNLVNLDLLAGVLRWLAPRLDLPPAVPSLATVLLAAAEDSLSGRLPAPAADLIDEVIASFALARREPGLSFLDHEERVPWARLRLVRGEATAGRDELKQLLGEHSDRGDLWGYLGDACTLLQRNEEANACYVRALLLSPEQVDLVHIRSLPLRRCFDSLRVSHTLSLARALLFSTAWLEGALAITRGNDWLDRLTTARLDASLAPAGDQREGRYRRFGLLLYRDRSSPAGDVDLRRREEMAALAPDLFARYISECERREQRGSPS
jgi:hypothetical protein